MKRKLWLVIHWLVILCLSLEILYGLYMVFFVIGGTRWPLFARAERTPVEVILRRRLYAIESWIAMGALSTYLAITMVLPRMLDIRIPGISPQNDG